MPLSGETNHAFNPPLDLLCPLRGVAEFDPGIWGRTRKSAYRLRFSLTREHN